MNNLKQIGLGIDNYNQSNNCFPPHAYAVLQSASTGGPSGVAGGTLSTNTDFSQNVRMLAYLEQQPLYNAANFCVGGCWNNIVSEQINSTVSRTKLCAVPLSVGHAANVWNLCRRQSSPSHSLAILPRPGMQLLGVIRVEHGIQRRHDGDLRPTACSSVQQRAGHRPPGHCRRHEQPPRTESVWLERATPRAIDPRRT